MSKISQTDSVDTSDLHTIEIVAPGVSAPMDVMHTFLKELRLTGAKAANTAIFENPAHAVMKSTDYTLKVWVNPAQAKTGAFKLTYAIKEQPEPRKGLLSRLLLKHSVPA